MILFPGLWFRLVNLVLFSFCLAFRQVCETLRYSSGSNDLRAFIWACSLPPSLSTVDCFG